MANRLPGPLSVSTSAHRLEVFRIQPGATEHVRCFSKRLSGCFAHWTGKNSAYCDPDGCAPSLHARPRFWKGYLDCEVYNLALKRWFPVVLEVTEHLELDFRGRYARGQVWELSRLPQTGRAKTPVTGKLVETLDPAGLRPEVDFMPVLHHLYHREVMRLGIDNPLPPRMFAEAAEGMPPPGIGERRPAVEVATLDQVRAMRQAAELAALHGATNGNGKH